MSKVVHLHRIITSAATDVSTPETIADSDMEFDGTFYSLIQGEIETDSDLDNSLYYTLDYILPAGNKLDHMNDFDTVDEVLSLESVEEDYEDLREENNKFYLLSESDVSLSNTLQYNIVRGGAETGDLFFNILIDKAEEGRVGGFGAIGRHSENSLNQMRWIHNEILEPVMFFQKTRGNEDFPLDSDLPVLGKTGYLIWDRKEYKQTDGMTNDCLISNEVDLFRLSHIDDSFVVEMKTEEGWDIIFQQNYFLGNQFYTREGFEGGKRSTLTQVPLLEGPSIHGYYNKEDRTLTASLTRMNAQREVVVLVLRSYDSGRSWKTISEVKTELVGSTLSRDLFVVEKFEESIKAKLLKDITNQPTRSALLDSTARITYDVDSIDICQNRTRIALDEDNTNRVMLVTAQKLRITYRLGFTHFDVNGDKKYVSLGPSVNPYYVHNVRRMQSHVSLDGGSTWKTALKGQAEYRSNLEEAVNTSLPVAESRNNLFNLFDDPTDIYFYNDEVTPSGFDDRYEWEKDGASGVYNTPYFSLHYDATLKDFVIMKGVQKIELYPHADEDGNIDLDGDVLRPDELTQNAQDKNTFPVRMSYLMGITPSQYDALGWKMLFNHQLALTNFGAEKKIIGGQKRYGDYGILAMADNDRRRLMLTNGAPYGYITSDKKFHTQFYTRTLGNIDNRQTNRQQTPMLWWTPTTLPADKTRALWWRKNKEWLSPKKEFVEVVETDTSSMYALTDINVVRSEGNYYLLAGVQTYYALPMFDTENAENVHKNSLAYKQRDVVLTPFKFQYRAAQGAITEDDISERSGKTGMTAVAGEHEFIRGSLDLRRQSLYPTSAKAHKPRLNDSRYAQKEIYPLFRPMAVCHHDELIVQAHAPSDKVVYLRSNRWCNLYERTPYTECFTSLDDLNGEMDSTVKLPMGTFLTNNSVDNDGPVLGIPNAWRRAVDGLNYLYLFNAPAAITWLPNWTFSHIINSNTPENIETPAIGWDEAALHGFFKGRFNVLFNKKNITTTSSVQLATFSVMDTDSYFYNRNARYEGDIRGVSPKGEYRPVLLNDRLTERIKSYRFGYTVNAGTNRPSEFFFTRISQVSGGQTFTFQVTADNVIEHTTWTEFDFKIFAGETESVYVKNFRTGLWERRVFVQQSDVRTFQHSRTHTVGTAGVASPLLGSFRDDVSYNPYFIPIENVYGNYPFLSIHPGRLESGSEFLECALKCVEHGFGQLGSDHDNPSYMARPRAVVRGYGHVASLPIATERDIADRVSDLTRPRHLQIEGLQYEDLRVKGETSFFGRRLSENIVIPNRRVLGGNGIPIRASYYGVVDTPRNYIVSSQKNYDLNSTKHIYNNKNRHRNVETAYQGNDTIRYTFANLEASPVDRVMIRDIYMPEGHVLAEFEDSPPQRYDLPYESAVITAIKSNCLVLDRSIGSMEMSEGYYFTIIKGGLAYRINGVLSLVDNRMYVDFNNVGEIFQTITMQPGDTVRMYRTNYVLETGEVSKRLTRVHLRMNQTLQDGDLISVGDVYMTSSMMITDFIEGFNMKMGGRNSSVSERTNIVLSNDATPEAMEFEITGFIPYTHTTHRKSIVKQMLRQFVQGSHYILSLEEDGEESFIVCSGSANLSGRIPITIEGDSFNMRLVRG